MAREHCVLVISPQESWVVWLVKSNRIFNLHQLYPLGFALVSSFQLFCSCLDFSSYFLSSLSWQYLQKESGGSPRSGLWGLLQCVYLSKRIARTLLKAILHIKSWASLHSSVLIWSSRMIWKKTMRANYRAQSNFQDAFFSSFSHAGYLGILHSWWTQFTFLLRLGKWDFRLYFEGKTR